MGTEPPEADFSFPRPAEAREAWAVLILEDNPELADFITESLPAHYAISRAADGVAGLRLATESLPDLIISDVMMPGLDGFSLCQQLKADPATNHIPLVLLTAKAAHESRIQGLSVGADDYLTKPFGVDELRLRVHNLLLARQRQRDWVRQSLTQVDKPLLPPIQDPFLAQFYAVLDQALPQSSLSLDQLADELAVSVRTLQRKLASLTGMTAIELMRAYRLRQAARRLQSGQPISSVAYEVGFENRSYFAKCFKEQFGLTPSEFAMGSSPR